MFAPSLRWDRTFTLASLGDFGPAEAVKPTEL